MRIEIMIDKEQKISQAILDALEAELLPKSPADLSKDRDPYSKRFGKRR